MESILREGFPHCLVVVGRAPVRLGGDVTAIEEAAFAQFGDVPDRVIGYQNLSDHELAVLMAGADALCSPSAHEGFGLTVLEAMASGAPVVVSNRGSLPELVGSAGLVVEPTAEDVAEGLRTILAHSDLSGLRSSARRQAEKFPWSRTASGWVDVASNLVL